MTANQVSPEAEVRRLAQTALRAVEREYACRKSLLLSSHKAARKGMLFGTLTLLWLTLLPLRSHHAHRGEVSDEREPSPGFFQLTGLYLAALMRWGNAANHFWTLTKSPEKKINSTDQRKEN